MSADKGGALVRSPPGLVEAYNAHVTGSAKWGEPSAPHIPPHKQSLPQRNASVTKLPSGSYQGGSSTYNNTSTETKLKKIGITEEDSDRECECNSWAKARQLEHDLDQLQRTHDVILSGLHNQLEEMKQKNRDLTFQLLMGPYANAVQVGVPLSPESDVTSPKDTTKVCRNGELEGSSDLGETKEPAELHREQMKVVILEKSNYIKSQKKTTKEKPSDPRQVRSLNLEILEEETEELTKQLEEERAKNKYLLTLVEDLKRQIREETGSWYPSNAMRIGQNASIKQKFDSRKSYNAEQATNPNLFKLPQLSYEPRSQLTDQEQQQQVPEMVNQGLQRKKDNSKTFERFKDIGAATTLPAIVRTGDNQQRPLERSKLEDGKGQNSHSREHSYGSRGKQQHKGRSKYRNHFSDHSAHLQETREQQNFSEQAQHSHKDPLRQKDSKSQKESQEVYESRLPSHKNSELSKSTNSVEQQFQEQQGEKRHSPRRRRTETGGESTLRTRTISRGRGTDVARSSRESSLSGKVVTSPSSKSRISNSPSGGNDVTSSHPERIGGAKRGKTKGLKNPHNFNSDSSASSLNVTPQDKPPEATIASSSSSVSSLTSSGSKSKHRGRGNKRGGKKNRKENQESAEEPRDK